jgi:hypothetical protein
MSAGRHGDGNVLDFATESVWKKRHTEDSDYFPI